MNNPMEEQQSALLGRIVNNVEKLNDNVCRLNQALQNINMSNMNVELISQMWANYARNAKFHLEETGSLKNPI
ncbi:DASH complex subunit Dad4 [Schizosaccharomyces cryophilus OY26]|uniref:DASH complex subunit DAD4 n=1 Tax=Schizosaccharomyces cryophilus (strain OY26 / ATCC MYA-4695 / CBS 11777 / NBRC 106824 / NRRL Y48691) TaxID=653667 RepID=S9W0Z6_SCHCR|nr:DASH complex subunit Dad4 [Schizosaccharomyces cryophilus OY26]EPY53558.1 DASH complex subunit Dad4 [Schizosaccharomyces cryophilus OY26]